jgi:hypothetical protein
MLPEAAIQSHLIKLGYQLENIDGEPGQKILSALEKTGIPNGKPDKTLEALEHLVQKGLSR